MEIRGWLRRVARKLVFRALSASESGDGLFGCPARFFVGAGTPNHPSSDFLYPSSDICNPPAVSSFPIGLKFA